MSPSIVPSFQIDINRYATLGQPLYFQIYQRFRDAIVNGSLPPSAKVPSIRTLAAELQLSRNTVEKAYDLLIGEGLFIASGQAGTVVAPAASESASTGGIARALLPAFEQSPQFGAVEPNPFRLGTPALDAFPLSTWLAVSQRVLRQRQTSREIVDRQGHQELRQAISAYLQVSRGVACTASQVFVVSGYRQAMAFLAAQLLKAGDQVWMEDPVYPPTLRVLRSAVALIEPVAVPVDMAGLDVDEACDRAPKARMAILTPANQSPLGVVLSLPRRRQLLAWAESSGSWIVEDDYDSEFCAEGRLQPTLYSLDRAGRTIYLGTFSKALHPALRVSYFVVPPSLVPDMRQACYDLLDGGCISLHRTLAAFMVDGSFGRHLKRMRALYGKRRQALVSALEAICGNELAVAPWARGLSVLAQLAPGISDVEVVERAESRGLSPGALSPRHIDQQGKHGLLLGYANFESEANVLKSVKLLASCISPN